MNGFEVHDPEEAILLFLEQDQDITLTVARPLKVCWGRGVSEVGQGWQPLKKSTKGVSWQQTLLKLMLVHLSQELFSLTSAPYC